MGNDGKWNPEGTRRRTLGKVMDNWFCLREHHEMNGDGNRVDLWYGNITGKKAVNRVLNFSFAFC